MYKKRRKFLRWFYNAKLYNIFYATQKNDVLWCEILKLIVIMPTFLLAVSSIQYVLCFIYCGIFLNGNYHSFHLYSMESMIEGLRF